MPIAINGSGTLTGLSVGGLEDGIITPAELSTGGPGWDAQSNLTNVASINAGPLAGMRNAIINGNFDIWQRGTSFTGSEYGADRWVSARNGTTHTVTRQAFTPGQTDVPGEPAYYCRTVVSSAAGANNLSLLAQPIEDVRTFAGQQVTISFWAKADATKNIAVELAQVFGSGGSPSATVLAIGVTKVSIGTSWQKIIITANVPSIGGKTLGTDNNSSFNLNIWFDAGSDYNSRTDTLGQQDGTFDIAQVQVEPGPVATPFERRPIGTELSLCQRYFCVAVATTRGYNAGSGFVDTAVRWPVTMRATPTVLNLTNNGAGYQTQQLVDPSVIGCRHTLFGSPAASDMYAVNQHITASAEL